MAKVNEIKEPKLPRYILERLTSDGLHEELLGDLSEIFEHRVENRGRTYAVFMYWFDVFHLLLGFSSFKPFQSDNHGSNLSHYTKIAYRNILRKKAYAFTNIAGLAIGIGVCLVIFQYVYFELSFDQFHKGHTNTYRVIIHKNIGASHESYPNALGYSFGMYAARTIPEIERFVRKERVNRTSVVTNPENNTVYFEQANNLFFVDPSFFEVFQFPLIKGNKTSVLSNKYSIAITEAVAKKYFGNIDAIGKQLIISGPPSPGTYTVTGVLKDIPLNTHLQFDFLMPIENYIEYGWGGAVKKQGGWDGFSVVTYFQVHEGANIEVLENKLNKLIAENTPEDASNSEEIKKVRLQAISDIYMKSKDLSYPGHFNSTGDFEAILTFSFISLIILLIAWVNYINLATAQSIQRAKEVGIRKSLGAQKKQLILQFIVESVIFNTIAAFLALGLAFLLLPILNQIIGKELELYLLHAPIFWPIFAIIILLGSFLAGLYPAVALSRFKPINMLKGNRTSQKTIVLRKSLIVFQFVTSLLLLSATYLIVKQTSFMKNQELSVDLDKILILRGPRLTDDKEKAVSKFRTFRNELAMHSSIHAATGSLFVPGQFWTSAKRVLGARANEAHLGREFYTTLNFENTYDLEFLAGRPFNETMQDETVNIINEAALASFGFGSPEDAIGQKLIGENEDRQQTIVGVVKNFHWHSLHEDHKPYVISLYENRLTENISIKLNTTSLPGTIEYIEATFQQFFPGNPFDYYFADTAFNNEYQAEDQFRKIFLCFTMLAILIACIGLLALVSYSLSMKIKEIGIRKVLGAGMPGLMLLLSKEYMHLIFIAMLLVFPTVWYAGRIWLQNYSYRISMSLDLFVYPVILLTLITLLTVSRMIFLASKTNPVESLRMN